jgi:hypothetical protein
VCAEITKKLIMVAYVKSHWFNLPVILTKLPIYYQKSAIFLYRFF